MWHVCGWYTNRCTWSKYYLISEKLNEDLTNVSDWMSSNKLSLNTSKTEYMIIGSHTKLKQINSDPLVVLGDFPIQRVKVTKSIGAMVDEALKGYSSPKTSVALTKDLDRVN